MPKKGQQKWDKTVVAVARLGDELLYVMVDLACCTHLVPRLCVYCFLLYSFVTLFIKPCYC
jgi:hypothetical protein